MKAMQKLLKMFFSCLINYENRFNLCNTNRELKGVFFSANIHNKNTVGSYNSKLKTAEK
jgi:hypothetical protein